MSITEQIEWCRKQQREALTHMEPGHTCSHPQCTPANNMLWINDATAEELLLLEEMRAK